jgi:hypothetical protein
MIEHKIRTYSETGTSIDQGIELSQKGVVVERMKRALKTLIIPTTLKDPRTLIITPLAASAGKNLSSGWHCDMNLYRASNANVSKTLTTHGTTAASNASGYADTLVMVDRELYISRTAVSGTHIASDSLVTGSASLFKKLTEFGTTADNAQKYLVATSLATLAGNTTIAKFAYEVRGY